MTMRPSRAPEPGMAPAFAALLERLSEGLEADTGQGRDVWDSAILDPAKSILTRSSKGIRARLVSHCWRLAGGAPSGMPSILPIAIELVHAGSLVVDDIEDDSRERRGGPALHRTHGVPVALNTGNWLYFLAMDLLTELPVEDSVRLAVLEDLIRCMRRCHEGQALDLTVHISSVRRRDARALVAASTRLKTGSLMGLAGRLGARAAGADEARVQAIGSFGREVGIGLQMLDDLSGIVKESRRAKGIEDLRLGRPTWPWAWLAESSDDLTFHDIARQGREVSLDWQAERLLDRLRDRVEDIGRSAITSQLDLALEGLASEFESIPELDRVASDVRSMAERYV